LFDAHRPHALAGAADAADVRRLDADHDPGGGDHEYVLLLRADECPRELARLVRQLVADDALAAAALPRVVLERRPLAVTLLGDGDHLLAAGRGSEGDH